LLTSVTGASKDLKNDPFRRPQETDTVLKYADLMTLFTIFLIRNAQHPVPGFAVDLDEVPQAKLDHLGRLLLATEAPDNVVISSFHELLFALLTHPSPAFCANQWKDPLLQFLIVYHLADDWGTFPPAHLITPNLSNVQWCLRATAAYEIILRKRADPNADCFRCAVLACYPPNPC
jgi:hypothetical protein